MRLLILVLGMGGMAVFFLQNQQPIALVFFGGSLPAQLPLAAWVLLFAAAGVLSSLVVGGLNALGRRQPAARDFSPPLPPPPRHRTSPKPPLTSEPVSAAAAAPAPAATSDWQAPPKPEAEEWDDWTVEAPPSPPPAEKQPPEPAIRESQLRNFEAVQQPQSASREGSLYSYRYREPRDRPRETPDSQKREKRETPKIGGVVDANYRVITPPYQPPSEPPPDAEEDEEWV